MRHAVLHALHISTFVLLWYVLSISLTLYNKWLFAVYGLRLPLLITALHFALKVPLARVAMACRGLRAPPLDWRTVAARIVPTGAATVTSSGVFCAGIFCGENAGAFGPERALADGAHLIFI